MKERDLAYFCKELAIMARAGMTLEETIEFIEEDSDNNKIVQVIKKIKEELNAGKSIEGALKSTHEFPRYMLHMIHIGLISKDLDEVLEQLSNTYMQRARVKERLKRAINYPIYLGSVMCIIMFFLVLKILPIFEEIFKTWNGEIVGVAKAFLNIGTLVSRCTIGVFGGVMVLIILGIFLVKTEKGRYLSNYLIGYTIISEKMDIARFAWTMGLMLEGNLNIEQSLQKSIGVIENKVAQQRVKHCIQLVGEKVSFDEALIKSKIFSKGTTRLMVNAFNNDQLEDVLKQVGEQGQRNLEYILENKVIAIETFSVGATSIIIGSILLTIMLPLMSIISML